VSELDIPESWGQSKFSALIKESALGIVRSAAEQGPNRRYRYLKMGDFSDGKMSKVQSLALVDADPAEVDKYSLREGDFIFNTRNSPELVGKTLVFPSVDEGFSPVLFNNNLMRIRFIKGVDSRYIGYFFRSKDVRTRLRRMVSGTTSVAAIYAKSLNDLEVQIPPLPEQHRVVTKIESTFKHIDAIEKATEIAESLLTKYRNSLLNKAFRGALVPQDPKDEPASKLLERIRAERAKVQTGKKKKDDLPPITEDEIPFEIPASWKWVRLGELCIKIGSGQTPRGGEDSYLETGVPLIRSQNVLNERLDLTQVAFIDKKTDQAMSNSRIFESDVLYNITGGSIGRSCVVPVGFPGGNVNQHVLSIRLSNPIAINPSFVSKFLLSPYGKDFIFRNKKGAARDAITKGQIENLVFPLPPAQEINRILDSIAKSERYLVALSKSVSCIKEKSKDIRSSLLNAAFVGRLVPQFAFEGTGHGYLEKIVFEAENTMAKRTRKNKL
jgi:type I restriction enzyme, S subunit